MPKSALPEHLNDPEEIENAFPDDSQYSAYGFVGRLYRWYNKKTKTWFAFSYRCTEWWAKWRTTPKILFSVGGNGPWRYETGAGEYLLDALQTGSFAESAYLSRCQYYKRWHIAIQWPLMISAHFYPKEADVPQSYKERESVDGKLWFFYWNHFDADLVYWMVTSLYLGRNWK